MKRIFKILLKIVLGVFTLLLLAFVALYLIYNEDLPEGSKPEKADILAQKMLKAIHHEAYVQTSYIEWTFAGGAHQYKWHKAKGEVEVKWSDYKVHLNLFNPNTSQVFQNSTELLNASKSEIITKAVNFFNNDSFWLVAPFKVFDKGTKRSVVLLEDGSEALLVTYSSGGTTPGDSYLWKLQANGFPISYQMWVKIIPIGGLEATWDDWKVMENGLYLPSSHDIGPVPLDMGEVRAYN
tara:strand:- start:93121 stop:93834 length:714 start_codon:yes stop_codon:yes gene_type:complete